MAVFFGLNCIVVSYAILFLGNAGFADGKAGLLVTVSAVIGGFFQFLFGRLADTNPKLYWKRQLLIFSICMLIISLLRLIPLSALWWHALTYGLMIVLIFIMMPMVVSASFFYSSHGIKVNFGVIRGVGSLAFAVVSYLSGFLADKHGPSILIWITIIFAAVLFLVVLIMPGKEKYPDARPDAIAEIISRKSMVGSLFKTYPWFFVMAFAIALIFVFHNIVSTYLIRIIESVGGDSGNLGVALAIAAVSEIPILFLYSRLAKLPKASTTRLIFIACAFFALRGVLFILAGNVFMIYVIQFLQCVSFALLAGAKATYADERMKAEDKTTGQAAMVITETFGMVAGSLLGGLLIAHAGVKLMLIVATAIAFAGTIIALIVAIKEKELHQ